MPEELTLLPCPACGASDVVMRVDTRAYGFCPACGMCGPCAPKVNVEYAVRQWNALPRSLGTSIKMEPSISLCRLTVYPIKNLVDNGRAPSTNPSNRSSPERGFSFSGGEHAKTLEPRNPVPARGHPAHPLCSGPVHDHRGAIPS